MKKIIITGGATRIGAAIAKKLSGPNIEIVIHYNKSKSKAENLKRELERNGAKIYLVKGDWIALFLLFPFWYLRFVWGGV